MINLWPQFCRSIIVFRLNHLHSRKFSAFPNSFLFGSRHTISLCIVSECLFDPLFFVQLTEFHPSKNGEEEKLFFWRMFRKLRQKSTKFKFLWSNYIYLHIDLEKASRFIWCNVKILSSEKYYFSCEYKQVFKKTLKPTK